MSAFSSPLYFYGPFSSPALGEPPARRPFSTRVQSIRPSLDNGVTTRANTSTSAAAGAEIRIIRFHQLNAHRRRVEVRQRSTPASAPSPAPPAGTARGGDRPAADAGGSARSARTGPS